MARRMCKLQGTIVYNTIGTVQISSCWKFAFENFVVKSAKRDDRDEISHKNSFCIFRLHAESIFSFSQQPHSFH